MNGYPLGPFRWEFRVGNLPTTPPASDILFIAIDSRTTTPTDATQKCRIPAGSMVISCWDSYNASPTGLVSVSFAGMTDVRVVVNRNQQAGSAGFVQMDLWKADCTAHITVSTPAPYQGNEPATANRYFALGGHNLTIGFFRSYSTLNLTPSCPVDAPSTPAPNMDFRFGAGGLKDVSGNKYGLSGSGVSLADSTYYNPTAVISGWQTAKPVFRAARAFQLDGSGSVVFTGNGAPSSYTWQQVSGPAQSSFTSPNSPTTSITAPVEGSYQYQLTVTDNNGGSGSSRVEVGLVDTDDNGVKLPAGELGIILGPVTRHGVNPWPWYDYAEAWDADVLATKQMVPPAPATLFSGLGKNDGTLSFAPPYTAGPTDSYMVVIDGVSPDTFRWQKNDGAWTNGVAITPKQPQLLDSGVVILFNSGTGHTLNDTWMIGPYQGTGQVTANCCNSIPVIGNGTQWQTGGLNQRLNSGDPIWVIWDADGAGSRTGRWAARVGTVTDDTHFSLTGQYYYLPPLSGSTNVLIQKNGPELSGYTSVAQPSASWDYYDNILGLYRLAERTNLSQYWNQARTFCSLWWQYGLEQGYLTTAPRNSGWQGMMACAADNQPGWWDAIASNVAREAGNGLNQQQPVARASGWDPRENSYILRATALLARLYPQHSANPTATQTTWCGYLSNQVKNLWLSTFVTVNNGNDGYWEENLCFQHCQYPAAGTPPGAPPGTHFGTSPWRDSGLANLALIEAFNTLREPSACNRSDLADQVSTTVRKSAQFIWDYGRSADGGLYYNVEYASLQGLKPGSVIHNLPDYLDPTLYVNATSGSSTVTGPAGSLFTTRFAPCDGTTKITIQARDKSLTTYPVAACPSDTTLTLGSAYTGDSATNLPYHNASTITVTKGSDQITGTDTAFTHLFAPCDGTTYIGIRGSTTGPFTDNLVYQVTACADDTHLTINQGYQGASKTIPDYERSVQSQSNCAPGIGQMCEPDNYSGKNLSHDAPASMGWLYYVSGDPAWKNKLEYMLGKAYGGPATGPGTNGPPAGPQADGNPNNFDSILPACNAHPAPCTRSSVGLTQMGKPFGMSAGAGNAPNAIAYYYGPSPCGALALSPNSASPSASGEGGSITVAAKNPACHWVAKSSAPWLSIQEGASGTGDGRITWSAAANFGKPRSATIFVNTASFTVRQGAGAEHRTQGAIISRPPSAE